MPIYPSGTVSRMPVLGTLVEIVEDVTELVVIVFMSDDSSSVINVIVVDTVEEIVGVSVIVVVVVSASTGFTVTLHFKTD